MYRPNAIKPASWETEHGKKSFVTIAQNVIQEQTGKIVDLAKAGYEGAKSLVGDAVTGTAHTAETIIGKPKRKATGKNKSPVKKAAAPKKAVIKKNSKTVATKRATKAAKKNSSVKNSAKRKDA